MVWQTEVYTIGNNLRETEEQSKEIIDEVTEKLQELHDSGENICLVKMKVYHAPNDPPESGIRYDEGVNVLTRIMNHYKHEPMNFDRYMEFRKHFTFTYQMYFGFDEEKSTDLDIDQINALAKELNIRLEVLIPPNSSNAVYVIRHIL